MAEGYTLDQLNAFPDVPSTPEGGFSLEQINSLPDAPKQNQLIRKGTLALSGLEEGLGSITKGIQTLGDMGTSWWLSGKNQEARDSIANTNSSLEQSVAKLKLEGKDTSKYEKMIADNKKTIAGFDDTIRTTDGIGDKIEAFSKEVSQKTMEAGGVDPNDLTFADKLAFGLGNTASYFVPALGVGRFASVLSKVPKIASFATNGAMTILEASQEAESVYKSNLDQGKDKATAQKKATNTFLANVALLGITNKLGLANDEIVKGLKNKLMALIRTGASEGTQEGLQQIISNISTDRPIMEGVKESAGIGAIIGTTFGGVEQLPNVKETLFGSKAGENVGTAQDTNFTRREQAGPVDTGNLSAIELQKQIEAGRFEPTTTDPTQTATTESIQTSETTPQSTENASVVDTSTYKDYALSNDSTPLRFESTGDTLKLDSSSVNTAIGKDVKSATENLSSLIDEYKPLHVQISDTGTSQEIIRSIENMTGGKVENGILNIPQDYYFKNSNDTFSQQAKEELKYYAEESRAGYRVMIPERNSSDLNVRGVSSTFPSWVPEHLRSKKLFETVYKQMQDGTAPKKGSVRQVELTNEFHKFIRERANELKQESIKNPPKIYDDSIDFLANRIMGANDIVRDEIMPKISRGMTAIEQGIDTLEINKNQKTEIKRFLSSIQPELLSPVGLSLKTTGPVQGSYSYGKKIITLYTDVIAKDANNFSYAFVHETWHALSPYLTDGDKNALTAQFNKDKARYVADNQWFKFILENQDGITEDQFKTFSKQFPQRSENWMWNESTGKYMPLFNPENYRFKNEDEYFAERLTEKTFERQKEEDADTKRANDIVEWVRRIMRKVARGVQRFYKKDIADDLADRFFYTRDDKMVRNDTTPKVRDLVALETTKRDNRFYGYNDISTRILQQLSGKDTVSKQYISDLTNQGDIKQSERDLIRSVLEGYDGEVNVKEFADEVKSQILTLTVNYDLEGPMANYRYEYVALPDSVRGRVANYMEKVYESPIKTDAGAVHFAGNTENYFGHTRLEDMEDGSTRRVIELQSDLFQKGRLEIEKDKNSMPSTDKEIANLLPTELKKEFLSLKESKSDNRRMNELAQEAQKINAEKLSKKRGIDKLEAYKNTWWTRMIREEMKQASLDDKKVILFPTGETAMKVEGLGQNEDNWSTVEGGVARLDLKPELLKVGVKITQRPFGTVNDSQSWIITEVLGDGKFKAISTNKTFKEAGYLSKELGYIPVPQKEGYVYKKNETEQFDISGKVDTSNPIYRFYEKDITSYLKNKYGVTPFTDEFGVTWNKVNVKESIKDEPVEAYLEEQVGIKKAIEFPELVGLATELMGNAPSVVAFRDQVNKKNGDFSPNGDGRIRLSVDLFKADDRLAVARTLAHEIGHLIDYLPTKTLTRGNILGRLSTLDAFRSNVLEGNNRKEIHTELYDLSKMWRPYDEAKSSKDFISYRKSGKEIYADFISTLFNDPQLAQRMAPKSYEMFFAKLDEKPSVRDAYFELQATLRNRPDILEQRLKSVYTMFDKADYTASERERLNQLADEQKRGLYFKAQYQFVDKGVAVNEKVKLAKAMGIPVADENNPQFSLEEDNYLAGYVSAEIRERFDSIVKDIERRGMTLNDLGATLMFDRVTKGDRQDVANPLGLQSEFVKEIYDDIGQVNADGQIEENKKSMRAVLGEENFNYLQNKAQEFRNQLKGVYKIGAEKGLYNEEALKLFDSNDFYIPFRPIKYSDQKTSFKVMGQKGTLSEIENPVITAINKAIAILETAERNKTKLDITSFFRSNFPADISEADTMFTNGYMLPVEPKEKGKGMIKLYDQGKLKGFYVDEYISESVARSKVGEQNLILSTLRTLNGPFRGLFITFNLGFQTFNVVRDFQRFWKNIPNMTIPTALKLYWKALPVAKARAFGLSDNPSERELQAFAFFEQLEKDKVLSRSFSQMSHDTSEERQYDRLMTDLGLNKDAEGKYANMVGVKQLRTILQFIEDLGTYMETIPKVAGVYALEGKTAPREMRSFVRKYVGSPDFLLKGSQTQWTNQVFMFSNAIIQGIRSDVQIAKDPKTASGFWWKTASVNMLPKLFVQMALAGLLGDELKKMYGLVSEYDKTNYTIVPMGINENGKVTYIRIPQDETGRFIGGIFWKIMSAMKDPTKLLDGATYTQLLDYTGGQIPSPSPVITNLWNLKQFMTGQNPYDTFRGRPVLTDDEFKAGGPEATKKFMAYIFQQMGGGIFMNLYTNERVPEKKTFGERVLALPVASNILGRWIKTSDYGETEDLNKVKKDIQQKDAQRRLENNELVKDAVREYNKDPSQGDMIKENLLNQQFPEGRIRDTQSKYDALKKKIEVSFLRGNADPALEALLNSNTNEEKKAILKKLRSTMAGKDYNDLIEFSITNKVISRDVANYGQN